MKKMFLLLLASAAMVSCGSDDNGGSKRPSMVMLQGGNETIAYNMSYDGKGRLNTMNSSVSGAHTFTFSYNESGKVSNVLTSGSTTDGVSFTYDSQGKLSSVTKTGQTAMPVTWTDATTLTYDGITIKLDNKGDLLQYDTATFTRDSGNGAFANVKGVDGLTMFIIESQTLFFASKKPAKIIAGTAFSYVMANTFQGGMLTSASFNAQSTPFTMTITY